MLRCLRCGTSIDGNAQFCAACEELEKAKSASGGSASSSRCTSCGSNVSQEMRHCPSCGRALGFLTCPSCRSPAPSDAIHCPSCRYRLAAQTTVDYAGFWLRLAANLIDGVILVVLDVLILLAVHDVRTRLLAQTAGVALYTVGFWVVEGATPGKMAMGIRIYTADGEPVGLGTAVVRYIGYFVSSLSFGIGYLVVAFTPRKRGLHDYIANTVVVRRI